MSKPRFLSKASKVVKKVFSFGGDKEKGDHRANIENISRNGIRSLYKKNKHMRSFICSNCLKSIVLNQYQFSCPFCDENYSSKVDFGLFMEALFIECNSCGGFIQFIPCYHCGMPIDLFAEYNEPELISARHITKSTSNSNTVALMGSSGCLGESDKEVPGDDGMFADFSDLFDDTKSAVALVNDLVKYILSNPDTHYTVLIREWFRKIKARPTQELLDYIDSFIGISVKKDGTFSRYLGTQGLITDALSKAFMGEWQFTETLKNRLALVVELENEGH